MKLHNKIVTCLLLPLVVLFLAKPVIAEPLEIVNPVDLTVYEQVEYFTNIYGGDTSINNKIMYCESRGNHGAVSDGGRSNGIMQFQKPTFDWMEKEFYGEYQEHLNYKSSLDQIKLFTWAMSKGYGRNWTAYRAIMNGGKYSFYSNQLKKYFTVTCR
jgi:hypothetical protein